MFTKWQNSPETAGNSQKWSLNGGLSRKTGHLSAANVFKRVNNCRETARNGVKQGEKVAEKV